VEISTLRYIPDDDFFTGSFTGGVVVVEAVFDEVRLNFLIA